MGLLDDAIREHLELKRRRGADPGEVAREERAALEPALADADGEHATDEHRMEADGVALGGQETATEPAGAAGPEEPIAELSTPAQETAELDMRSVLEADVHEGPQGDPLAAEALSAPRAARGLEEELVEWETPERRDSDGEEGLPEQIPGQERMSFE